MRCAVCGRAEASVCRWVTQGGTDYGSACRGTCAVLLWEAHFVRATGGTEDELALCVWKWRRRRAEVAGRGFAEPMPETEADAEWRRLLESRGWGAIAREVA